MKYAASSGFILTQKSSGEKNCELGGYQGNKLGYILLELPSTAQRFSPMSVLWDEAIEGACANHDCERQIAGSNLWGAKKTGDGQGTDSRVELQEKMQSGCGARLARALKRLL
jgi:hypothetical protein